MAATQIRGSTQIIAGTILDAQIAAGAGIQTSKLAEGSQFLKRSGGAGTSYDAANGKIINLADPTSAQDGATKGYVDAVKAGLSLKGSVRVATTTSLPSHTRSGNTLTATSNGALGAIDGVTLSNGDRLLVKNEGGGTHLENGIYVVTATGGPVAPWVLNRGDDANTDALVKAGMYTFADQGTANADSGWVLITDNPITLNTTALTFTQYSGAGQITAGAGLTKTGNTLDVGAGAGMTVNADDIAVIYGLVGELVAEAIGSAAAAGSLNKAARVDHLHAMPAAAAPTTTHGIGQANAAGAAATLARSDHAHALAAAGAPAASAVGDTAVTGVATTFAASDHKHAREAFATPNIGLGTAAAAGVATTPIRSDATILAFDVTAPVTQAIGDAAATGAAAVAARRDHRHGMPAFAAPTVALSSNAGAGVATTLLRSDAILAAFDLVAPSTQAIGDAAVIGSINYAARRDHKHGMPAFGTPTGTSRSGDANAGGAAATIARSDHMHARENEIYNEVPAGLINGANKTYTLANTPTAPAAVMFFWNGLLMQPGAGNDYALSGNTITIDASVAAPVAGDVLLAYYTY